MKQINLLTGIVVSIFLMMACSRQPELTVTELTCNFKSEPVGVDTPAPLLGWKINSSQKEVMQSAYRIIVAENPDDLIKEKGTLWDSGKIESEQSFNTIYEGEQFDSGKKYFWKVKIWDANGNETAWSKTSWWQTGMFSDLSWKDAQWIAIEELDPALRLVPGIHGSGDHLGDKAVQRPIVPKFRKSFSLSQKPESATLFISGLGHYEAFLNGKKIGNSFLSPGWTQYDKTILYNTYDVTSLLATGENVLSTVVGNGFYNVNRERYRKLVIAYGMPKMISLLHIRYPDGTSETIPTDGTWKTTPSPITYTSIFGGEDYNATLAGNDWNSPGFNDSHWQNALVVAAPTGKLAAENDYPLKEMEKIEVKEIISLGDSSWLYDFGQNASGIIELTVRGKAEQEIKLWPAELLNPNKTVNQRASGYPFYFSYTLSGNGLENWKPQFTYYGFRYVQISGAVPAGKSNPEGLPEIEKLTFLHTRNSSPENGTFECSNPLLNQIHTLIDWAIRSNFQSVLTDCPHREKLGWLEQTHLMGQGVHFRYDIYHLYRKLVFDMIDSQTEDGLVPDIAPEYVEFLGGFRDSPEWGSAAVILPYLLYKWYGDREIIEQAWPMMNRYVNYLKSKSESHILNHGLGDWFDLGPRQPGVSQLTPVSLTATATYFYNLKVMAEMAQLLNKPEKQELQQWADEIRQAFNSKFFNAETNVYSTGSQTAMSMPYCMEIVEEANREKVFANLVDSITAGNKALTAGDVGFHYLVEALTKGGAAQLMYEMINRDDVPGYGFQLKKGATALTESWAALENVSNNHLMLGHVMEWFYAGLGGIGQAPHSVAYKDIELRPEVAGDLTFVKSGFNSPYGKIRSEWKRNSSDFQIEVEIPHNTSATLFLPDCKLNTIKIDGKKPESFRIQRDETSGKIKLKFNSGVYRIETKLTRLD